MTYFLKKKQNLFYLIATIIVFITIPSFLFSQALEYKKNFSSEENSQLISLLSPSFGVNIPKGIGGPIYNNDGNEVLKSSTGIFTDNISLEEIDNTNGISIYVVRKGDTLSEIAELFDVSVNTIKWENNLKGNTLRVGQELRILPVTGISYAIKKGDTFAKIAKKYEVEIEDITVFNNLNETKLPLGKKIIIPNGVKQKITKTSPKTKIRSSKSTKKIGGVVKSGYYLRPTAGGITSRFGPRHGSYHYGIDFGGYRGAPIVASASGKVIKTVYGCTVRSWRCGGGYGNHIIIQHNNGTKTKYAHMKKVIVRKGDSVVKGQKIGEMGNTGNVRPRPRSSASTAGTHLHFEIVKSNGSKMNPNRLF